MVSPLQHHVSRSALSLLKLVDLAYAPSRMPCLACLATRQLSGVGLSRTLADNSLLLHSGLGPLWQKYAVLQGGHTLDLHSFHSANPLLADQKGRKADKDDKPGKAEQGPDREQWPAHAATREAHQTEQEHELMVKGPGGRATFNRKHVLHALRTRFGTLPRIWLLTGPTNSGKSTLLQQLQLEAQDAGDDKDQKSRIQPVLYLDMRAKDMLSAERFASALEAAFTPFSEQTVKGFKLALKTAWLALRPTDTTPGPKGIERLNQVMASTEVALRKHSFETRPILVIDSAHQLQSWSTEAEEERLALDCLLQWFVRITKQQHLAHVVLATSDGLLANWLDTEVGGGHLRKLHIGDLPKQEARHFWEAMLLPKVKAVGLDQEGQSDEVWETVYGVCGGRIHDLQQCVADAAVSHCFNKGLQGIVSDAVMDVRGGLQPVTMVSKHVGRDTNIQPDWTARQWADVARTLIKADGRGVPASTMSTVLGQNGSRALRSMVHLGLLQYYVPGALLGNAPEGSAAAMSGTTRGDANEILDEQDMDAMVTAVSPAHLYAMRRLHEMGILDSANLPRETHPAEASDTEQGASNGLG